MNMASKIGLSADDDLRARIEELMIGAGATAPVSHDAIEAIIEMVSESKNAELEIARSAMRRIKPYIVWTVGDESPGHPATMGSAVAAFLGALNTLEAKAPPTEHGKPQLP